MSDAEGRPRYIGNSEINGKKYFLAKMPSSLNKS